MQKIIRAFAPATVANVACGFDVLGFALSTPGDIVTVRNSEKSGVDILNIIGDDGKLPREAARNTAGIAIISFLEALDIREGVSVELDKQLPLCSGLGSSGASAVAALVAVNKLFDNPLERVELLPFAVAAEKLACGAAHADNVAPSLLGGFTLVRNVDLFDVVRLSYPEVLCCAVVHPHLNLATKDSRAALPTQIDLADSVQQSANLGGLVHGLASGEFQLIGRCLEDRIAEPNRKRLIPHFDEVKEAALDSGALGCSLSGSGPSVFALCQSMEIAQSAGRAMKRIFIDNEIEADLFVSQINKDGARLLP
ncbi:MAG: homoserine kinase [Calditrichia bacterium]